MTLSASKAHDIAIDCFAKGKSARQTYQMAVKECRKAGADNDNIKACLFILNHLRLDTKRLDELNEYMGAVQGLGYK